MNLGTLDVLIDREETLRQAALSVYARYAIEIVEGLGFCPWAAKARRDGLVKNVVVLDREPSPERALAEIDRFVGDRSVEIGLILFPRVHLPRLEFEHWVGSVRSIDERRGAVVYALAAFHPEAEPDLASPGRLLPFIRRTPDPVIQCVRRDVLDRVRAREEHGTSFVDLSAVNLADPSQVAALGAVDPGTPIHERVAKANHDTIAAMGADRVRALLDDILRERDARYAALGEPARARR